MAKPAYRAGRDQAATSENVELLTGQRGDKLDKAVTFRELNALGLATLRPGAGGIYVPGKNPDLFPVGVYDKPHAPVNVQASGAFHTVLVDWDGPTYRGHSHAEVWRAETDSLPAATLVGTTIANMFSDAIGKGATFYYWVRFVNGKDDRGPFHGEHGAAAETSRDVQDILDELQGKIESSHLAQELLKPILDVPQLSVIVNETKANLAALDAREKQINDLLNHAQGALGDNYVNVTLVQERLRQLINGYKGDFEDFREAVFSVDPSTGEITMDAVNAVRSELGAQITQVSQHLDAVEAIVKTCVTRAEISGDLEKITSIEQQIDGISGKLTQTATKSEVTAVGSQVTQVGQELDVVKGALTQKAAKTEVDAQGQRLTVAEQQISANTTANSATAQRIDQLKSELQLADQTIKSSITELAQSVASDTQALARKMSAMEVAMNGNAAAISELNQAVSGDGQSLASKFENISASVDLTGDAAIGATLAGAEESDRQRKATGKIRREQKVISDQQQAMATTLEQLDAEFQAESADLRGQIINEQTVRATETGALAQRVGTVEAEFKAADSALGASISEVAKASADADSALASQIQQVTANYQGADERLTAQITAESTARANDVQSLASQINTVSAVAGSKNKTFFQATAPSNGMGTGDLWFDTSNNNRPYRYSGTAWVATDDPRIAANAAAVQSQSQAIADLQNGAQAMWSIKAQAGDIKAGIGLVAKSDGTSQVALSASQVFVFDPNSSTPLAPLFAIDNGQAVIAEAIIRKATIQILNSEKITADYVKAGVSISSPLINGGQIDMGNAFLSGGAAGFGKGGPYGGWGWGWYTIIYADGSIYTNRLYAEGGYVRNMTIGNCTIDQNCIVHGTIFAERIVGDVAAIKSLYMQQPSGPFSMFFNVAAANFTRGVIVTGINIKAEGYYYGGGGQPSEGTRACTAVFYMNGVEFGRESVSATGGSRKDSATASATVTLPAGVRGQFQVSILGDVSVSLVGAVAMVFKHGSATFE
ncbi:phage tail tip fiber protein [Aeromonas caviae]